jgi:hypothetical protein
MIRPKHDPLSVLKNQVEGSFEAASLLTEVKNPGVLASLLPSAARGFLLHRGKQGAPTLLPSGHDAYFDWSYTRDRPEMRALYTRAKQNQWDADVAISWDIDVDPMNPATTILPTEFLAIDRLSTIAPRAPQLTAKEELSIRYDLGCWMLSQFLHGEQGALQAAAQVTESVRWLDGKLYGSTQVMDEARHVEVFHRYLESKLNKLYSINDNLYVIIDALMRDSRWDMKFLGMQIMIEGLALGAFGMLYQSTSEPLLRELLKYVIQDEARHVHYGVVALREHYLTQLSPKELSERQDWAFEVALLMRNRFMAHEIYEERFQGVISRKQWNQLVQESPGMAQFRQTMFERLVPNLRYIGLLDRRMEAHYHAAGLLRYADGKDAAHLSGDEMIADLDRRRESHAHLATAAE